MGQSEKRGSQRRDCRHSVPEGTELAPLPPHLPLYTSLGVNVTWSLSAANLTHLRLTPHRQVRQAGSAVCQTMTYERVIVRITKAFSSSSLTPARGVAASTCRWRGGDVNSCCYDRWFHHTDVCVCACARRAMERGGGRGRGDKRTGSLHDKPHGGQAACHSLPWQVRT